MFNMGYTAPELADFYKSGHLYQYPENQVFVCSNITARSSKFSMLPKNVHDDKVVVFGVKHILEFWFKQVWEKNFFNYSWEYIEQSLKDNIGISLNSDKIGIKEWKQLYDLGYLPLEVKSLDEGTLCPVQVPFVTVHNTHKEFNWLTSWIETMCQYGIYPAVNSATTARVVRQLLENYAKETGGSLDFVDFQGHDFSMRGLKGFENILQVSSAHALYFRGSDSIPVVRYIKHLYNSAPTDFIVGSVNATEHSVACSYGDKQENEEEYFEMMLKIAETGKIVSIVSDTYDYFNFIRHMCETYKDRIVNLPECGKIVFRPDSQDPYEIINGKLNLHELKKLENPLDEQKGTLDLLWEIFGGTVNSLGYKHIFSKVGAIYGDGMRYESVKRILDGMKSKGYASDNLVFGLGSFGYVYDTRDTYSIAMKATYAEYEDTETGEIYSKDMFKDPVGSTKKSHKGLLLVYKDEYEIDGIPYSELKVEQGVTRDRFESDENMLKTVFLNGEILLDTPWDDVRKHAHSSI